MRRQPLPQRPPARVHRLPCAIKSPDFSQTGALERLRTKDLGTAPRDACHPETRDAAREAAYGSVEVITGPMFAGKTKQLLSRVRELEKRGDRVLLVKSGVDDRYSATEVVSHDGERRACVAVPDLRNLLGRPELAAAQVVAVDEAQFFHDLAPFCNFVADSLGKRVIVAGLLGNYRREPFGHMAEVLPLADAITTLYARCAFCEGVAHFTVRLRGGDAETEVGGADKYQPVCRRHFDEHAPNLAFRQRDMAGWVQSGEPS